MSNQDSASLLPQPCRAFIATGDDLLDAYLRHLSAPGTLSVHRIRDESGLSTLRSATQDDILVLDERLVGEEHPLARELLAHPKAVLISERDLEGTVRLLATHKTLAHVLIRDGGSLPHQLATTLDLMLGRATFGIARYLAPGAGVSTHVISSTAAKQALLTSIAAAAQGIDGFSELPAVVETIASELVMNAMFNAPHTASYAVYRDRPRHEPLNLRPGEEVTVAFGHDEHAFVLAVRDNFGMLTRETLVANFQRSATADEAQIRMKTAGAGVGLYMVFNSVSQLDLNVRSGTGTEIIAVVPLSKRYRDFARSGHSVNLYFNLGD